MKCHVKFFLAFVKCAFGTLWHRFFFSKRAPCLTNFGQYLEVFHFLRRITNQETLKLQNDFGNCDDKKTP